MVVKNQHNEQINKYLNGTYPIHLKVNMCIYVGERGKKLYSVQATSVVPNHMNM